MALKVKGRYMRPQLLSTVLFVLVSAGWAWAQQPSSCARLMNLKHQKVEITKPQASESRDYESCANPCGKYRINSLESKSQRAAAGILPNRRGDQSTHWS